MNATTHTETLTIDGMSCGHCVRAVDEALRQLEGVEVESVEIGMARVRYDASSVSRGRLVQAIEDEGYTVR